MTTPHRCPVCDGSGVYAPGHVTSAPPTRSSHPCHGCDARGWVQVPGPAFVSPLQPEPSYSPVTFQTAPAVFPWTTCIKGVSTAGHHQ